MQPSSALTPNYGNWVSTKLIYLPAAAGILSVGLSILPQLRFLSVAAGACFLVAGYFAYARYRFSPAGGNIQAQVQALALARLDWTGEGQALDIGCGNGPLTIELARHYPVAQVVGIDYWGEMWEYAQGVCERNAALAGVAGRVSFRKASAAALPFEGEAFDAAVSNLVFHEVKEARDKRELIREALRVVKPGGVFAFQDLFLERHLYGQPDELVAAVRSWGITQVAFVKTCDAPFIPAGLKLPFMIGKIGVLYGKK